MTFITRMVNVTVYHEICSFLGHITHLLLPISLCKISTLLISVQNISWILSNCMFLNVRTWIFNVQHYHNVLVWANIGFDHPWHVAIYQRLPGIDYFTRSPLFSHKNPNVMHYYEAGCVQTHTHHASLTQATRSSSSSWRWSERQKESDAFLFLFMFSFNSELYSCLPRLSRSSIR